MWKNGGQLPTRNVLKFDSKKFKTTITSVAFDRTNSFYVGLVTDLKTVFEY